MSICCLLYTSIAVIGFDDLPLTGVIEPALSTIHVPKQFMGEAAAQRLISLIRSSKQPPIKIEVSTTLIQREST